MLSGEKSTCVIIFMHIETIFHILYALCDHRGMIDTNNIAIHVIQLNILENS